MAPKVVAVITSVPPMKAKLASLYYSSSRCRQRQKSWHYNNSRSSMIASRPHRRGWYFHYSGVIMGAIASPIASLTIVYSIVYSGAYQRKHQSSASLAFVWGIHRGPVNSPHKWPVTRKMFPFDDVIMIAWPPRRAGWYFVYFTYRILFLASVIPSTLYVAPSTHYARSRPHVRKRLLIFINSLAPGRCGNDFKS